MRLAASSQISRHFPPRTAEVHTTAILKKSRKESRARLAVWFWTEC